MADGFLHRFFVNNGGKRLHKWLHYFDIYERHFERFRGTSPTVLEVGIAGGGSLAMWREYFGPGSTIVGIDVNPDCKQHEGEGIEVYIGSQDDRELLDAIFLKHPVIDILIDDGSHIMSHVNSTFDAAYHRISPRGVYLVEDMHTSYWEKYEGGVNREGTFMEVVKSRIDELNAVHTKGVVPVTEFTRSTDFISIYDSVVVFEKRPQGARQAPVTSGMK